MTANPIPTTPHLRLVESEEDRRRRIIAAGGTVADMAEAIGLTITGLRGWARNQGIPLPSRRADADRRTELIADLIAKGAGRAQILEASGLTPDALTKWARKKGLHLPQPPRASSDRPMCIRCGHYKVTWNAKRQDPARHGLCQPCRAKDLGRLCDHPEGCDEGAMFSGRCSLHRDRPNVKLTRIDHHAVAFRLWSPEPSPIYGVSPNAEASWHTDCAGCKWTRTGTEAEVKAWTADHNRQEHR